MALSKMPTALVTGASSGLGRYLAVHLSKQNRFKIALFGRNVAALQETYSMMKSENDRAEAEIFPLDFAAADSLEIEKRVTDCCENYGDLSLLVNSAGLATSGNIEDIDLDETDRMIDVNLRSIIHITKHCVPYLKGEGGDTFGENKAIVNIGSKSSLSCNVGPDRSIYVATKHALKGFSDCLFQDIGPYGIKVCCVMPHFINTEMIDKIERNHFVIPHRDQLIQPSDIAHTIDYILSCSPHACPTDILIRTHRRFT